jgi:hypothetical protein
MNAQSYMSIYVCTILKKKVNDEGGRRSVISLMCQSVNYGGPCEDHVNLAGNLVQPAGDMSHLTRFSEIIRNYCWISIYFFLPQNFGVAPGRSFGG